MFQQSISQRDGSVLGGHVMGGKVFTTLELVLGTLPGVVFTREVDPETGYDELVVRPMLPASKVSESNAQDGTGSHERKLEY